VRISQHPLDTHCVTRTRIPKNSWSHFLPNQKWVIVGLKLHTHFPVCTGQHFPPVRFVFSICGINPHTESCQPSYVPSIVWLLLTMCSSSIFPAWLFQPPHSLLGKRSLLSPLLDGFQQDVVCLRLKCLSSLVNYTCVRCSIKYEMVEVAFHVFTTTDGPA
jgi:hypothetical protein